MANWLEEEEEEVIYVHIMCNIPLFFLANDDTISIKDKEYTEVNMGLFFIWNVSLYKLEYLCHKCYRS